VSGPGGPGQAIFGTDGVRDRSGEGLLAVESLEQIVRAAVSVLGRSAEFPEDFPAGRGSTVLLARDTRDSGAAIAEVLSKAFARFGHPVADLGVLPTPGVAWLAAAWPEAVLGVMISASHNPAEYNGIKLIAPTGAKISPGFEKAVSDAYWRRASPRPSGAAGRPVDRSAEAHDAYVARLVRAVWKPERLQGKTVAVDAANGATYLVAPEVFERLGMRVRAMGNEPDGRNINLGCGALHPQPLAALALESKAAVGFSFDGDGDRMIPVTARGTVLDGDHVLYLAGKSFLRSGRLPGRTVVATIMSNVGLELALRKEGLELLRTDVGDRNVYLAMLEKAHPVGGEQSGHIIFLDDARTGDGVLAALRLLDVLETDELDLEREAAVLKRYPQVLKNVRVLEKKPLESLLALRPALEAARARLGGEGRILLRYSGTEPLLRVMVEGPDSRITEELAEALCEAVRDGREAPGAASRSTSFPQGE
jgi:phosphoglucosamine mutase